jgi:uncharacterized lipoprotein YmbA
MNPQAPTHGATRGALCGGPAATGAIASSLAKASAGAAAAALLLAACASTSPPPQLYQLRSAPPVRATALMQTALPPQPAGPVLQLLLPVSLPEVLERDAIVVELGLAGLQTLPGHRWAEPLRDAVPRLLRQDLATLLGPAQVWVAPLPAGLVVQQQLRVDVLALQTNAARTEVQLQVRWTLAAPAAASPPASASAAVAPLLRVETLSAPVSGADVDAIVAAHRVVLWRLAEAVAASVKARALP